MKVAYVAGPYRSNGGPWGIRQNIRAAEVVAVELWRMGFAVICPHLNSALLDGAVGDKLWLEGYLEILRRCDLVVMVPDWHLSAGAKEEHLVAIEAGIPVYYWGGAKERTFIEKNAGA